MTDLAINFEALLPPGNSAPASVPVDDSGQVLSAVVAETIRQLSFTSARALQVTVGASEIRGPGGCLRQQAYRALGVPAVNFPDPLKSWVGTGVHSAMAEAYRRLDAGSGRYLVEHPITYRGVPGTVDLYDRATGTVVDWKTTNKAKVRNIARNGPPVGYVVQVNLYAAALMDTGERVERVALVYLPTDGALAEAWSWVRLPDRAMADEAVDRFLEVKARAEAHGPEAVPPTPGPLCPWCQHFRPNSADLSVACPGKGIA